MQVTVNGKQKKEDSTFENAKEMAQGLVATIVFLRIWQYDNAWHATMLPFWKHSSRTSVRNEAKHDINKVEYLLARFLS